MAIGSSLVVWVPSRELDPDEVCPNRPAFVWSLVLLPLLAVSFNMFFKARIRQYPIMTLTAMLAFAVSKIITTYLPGAQEIQAVAASLVVGLTSNIYARIYNEVAIAPLLSGILLLVPGALGVKSAMGFLGKNTVNGGSFAFQMLTIGLSITVGLFIGSLIVWPMKPMKPYKEKSKKTQE